MTNPLRENETMTTDTQEREASGGVEQADGERERLEREFQGALFDYGDCRQKGGGNEDRLCGKLITLYDAALRASQEDGERVEGAAWQSNSAWIFSSGVEPRGRAFLPATLLIPATESREAPAGAGPGDDRGAGIIAKSAPSGPARTPAQPDAPPVEPKEANGARAEAVAWAEENILARAAAVYAVPKTPVEAAWLIERGQLWGQSPTLWWVGDDKPRWEEWSEDALKARRYATEEAAQQEISRRSGVLVRHAFGHAVEHVFLTPDAGAAMSADEYHARQRANAVENRERACLSAKYHEWAAAMAPILKDAYDCGRASLVEAGDVAGLVAENARLRFVVRSACQYNGALDSGGAIEINDTHEHLIAAVRGYEAASPSSAGHEP